MNTQHAETLVTRYCDESGGKWENIVPGFWVITVSEQKIRVNLFPQPSRWGDLTSLIVNLDLSNEQENLKYRHAWSDYPLDDQIEYDSFESAVNDLLEKYQADQDFERDLRKRKFGFVKRS